MPGALPGKWPRLPGMGPLGGIDGYFACSRCGAWTFPGEATLLLTRPRISHKACFLAARGQFACDGGAFRA